MADTEEYFPRGGKKPTVTHFKQNSNFLGTVERGEKKKKKPKKKSEADDGYLSDEAAKQQDKSYKNCAIGLSYRTAKPGLSVLGRVSLAYETKVKVMLPGRVQGIVMACHISEPYNKLLEAYVNDQIEAIKEIPQMFRPGQYVTVQVLEVDGDKLLLSMMPQHVNGNKKQADLHNGCILQAAVSSVEDHGYLMDIGIPNTRAFMPKNNTNPELELDVGTLTWCSIKSVSSESGVVTLSSHLDNLQSGVQRKKPSSGLLPNTAVDFIVDKPLDNGIEGHIFSDTTAYIQSYHADKVKGKKPALGQKVRARVLYAMPPNNTPFLTMRNIFEVTYPDLSAEQKLLEGDIVEEAQVIRITGRSIHFKLGKGCLGTMSLKRIQIYEDLTDEEVVAKSYPIGSTHKVRVLCYHLSDYMYSVTDQASIVNEKYFKLDSLSVGQVVTGTVSNLTDGYLTVTVGRLNGIVLQNHMFDAGTFIDPKKPTTSKFVKKKFKVGQEVKARVLSIDLAKNNLVLTLKPSLLGADLEVLSSYQQAQRGKAYTGVIRTIRDDYLLVSFFGNVIAYVPRNYVTKDSDVTLTQAYHIGQIVNCTIIRVYPDDKKMTGSLTTAPFWPDKPRENTLKRKHNNEVSESAVKKKKKNEEHEEDDSREQNEKENNKERKKKKYRTPSESEDVETEMEDVKTRKKKKDKKSQEEVTIEQNETENKNERKKKKDRTTSESEDLGIEIDYSKTNKKKKDKKSQLDTEVTETKLQDKPKKKKDKNSQNVEDTDETTETENAKDRKRKRDKKSSVLEESDAIETDVYDNEVLTPDILHLIDFSDCINAKKYKKRIASILRSIKNRVRRLDKIDTKIQAIESKGLDRRNKKFHTAMHTDKLVTEKRIEKLMEALIKAQENLKQFGDEIYSNKDYKKKKGRNGEETNKDLKKNNRKESESKIDENSVKKVKAKDVKVVESLEPAIEVPSAKDFWSASVDVLSKKVEDDESSSSGDEEKDQPKKKRKKLSVAEKLSKVREEEERVREMERRAIESEAQPRSSEQFERALLANPDSSQLWIAYMAFHLQATEIEKARAVCRKALNTINFREEQERLNVWLAMLNCEHRFGTKESQQKTLEEALQMNDKFKIHSKLLDILVETSKHQELTSLVDLMLRKYKQNPQNYILCGGACFKLGLVDKARHAMQKAIAVLEKKEHVNVLVQFALMERSSGAPERAEALFEQILAIYPQRVDVCNVYVDMLVKSGDAERVRQVMERLTSQKLPARKMKILYKKWIEVEEKLGDKDEVEAIRQRAMEFIEKAKF